MTIHELRGTATPQLERGLAAFEAQFGCGVGGGPNYRMTYPAGYLRYLESLGESRCYVEEKDERIVGMIGGALLQARLPNGERQPMRFIEEVKLEPSVRRTRALWPLLTRWQEGSLPRPPISISVVLDETPIKPSEYTGRAGIVPLRNVGNVMVIRIVPTGVVRQVFDERYVAGEKAGAECHRQLTAGRYAVLSTGAENRSVCPLMWLVHPSGAACGRLEDRRKVRQVTMNDGTELKPLFLGSFAFRDAMSGLELIAVALGRCGQLGYTAVRMVVSVAEHEQLIALAGQVPGASAIPGAIYASGVKDDAPWNLSSLEI